MNIEPHRLIKLQFEGISYKRIARNASKPTHSIKAWIMGGYGYDRRVSR
jgi:hypothetical protein